MGPLWEMAFPWLVGGVCVAVAGFVVWALARSWDRPSRTGSNPRREALLRGLPGTLTMPVVRDYEPPGPRTARYRFSFERQPGGAWRAFILSQPGYAGRPDSHAVTHRLTDGGRPYVCFTPEPQSLRDAARVAMTWADRTEHYVRVGRF